MKRSTKKTDYRKRFGSNITRLVMNDMVLHSHLSSLKVGDFISFIRTEYPDAQVDQSPTKWYTINFSESRHIDLIPKLRTNDELDVSKWSSRHIRNILEHRRDSQSVIRNIVMLSAKDVAGRNLPAQSDIIPIVARGSHDNFKLQGNYKLEPVNRSLPWELNDKEVTPFWKQLADDLPAYMQGLVGAHPPVVTALAQPPAIDVETIIKRVAEVAEQKVKKLVRSLRKVIRSLRPPDRRKLIRTKVPSVRFHTNDGKEEDSIFFFNLTEGKEYCSNLNPSFVWNILSNLFSKLPKVALAS